MNFKEYKYLIYSDLYRIIGKAKPSLLIWNIFMGGAFKYNFWMRTCIYAKNNIFLKYSIYYLIRFFLHRLKYRLGISIPPETRIGSGFYIGHFGGIVVNRHCIIGRNCNISHGVTLGIVKRGKNRGSPILKDNIYLGAGAKIIGAVHIGNNVAIGANCVVTKDIPDNAVVVGIPGRIISMNGSAGYVNNTDYETN